MEMDFQFLYHPQRRVFHNGFNLDTGQLDNNYYDLLASEARIASIIALAKGEVPQSHWLQLGRPLTRVEGLYVLLSWSATMFEYLMPPLFLRSYPGTLLADSAQGRSSIKLLMEKRKVYRGVFPNPAFTYLMPIKITNIALLEFLAWVLNADWETTWLLRLMPHLWRSL